ncbi:rod shape-determining protein MreC [Candidatus Pseudothioglobus sp. Uisw_050_01]|uniref:rod shape-determining protein MreC n=1 Tax=Candidatus Pseudothioglobus sp. Uisw_050_01 TaxID=3230997 RepID=UPI003A836AB9
MRLLKLCVPVFLSIILIVLDTRFSYLDSFKKLTLTLLSPIYVVVDLPSQVIDWVNEKGAVNEVLISENDYLNGQLIELKVRLQTYNNLALENQKISGLLNSSYEIPNHDVLLASVKSISQSRLSKIIVIDKGSNDKVTLSQLIIGSDGAVGQVMQVTPMFSTVRLLTDPTQFMPVKNSRNGIRGITKGLASNETGMIVEYVPLDSDIKVGDLFLTSGIGNSYPSGYLVGRVTSIDDSLDASFLSITLQPSQNMNKLEMVLIIKGKND